MLFILLAFIMPVDKDNVAKNTQKPKGMLETISSGARKK